MWPLRKNDNLLINSEEYEKLTKRIIEIQGDISELKNIVRILETNYNNLRGNFNRKLLGVKKEEVDETQSINNPVLLPFNGSFK